MRPVVVVVVSPSSGCRASLVVGSRAAARLWPPGTPIELPPGHQVIADHADTAAEVGARRWLYPLRVGTRGYINADVHAWGVTRSGLPSLHARAEWVAQWAECMIVRRRRTLPRPPRN